MNAAGETFPTQQNISVVKDAEGAIIQVISLFSDISEKKLAEERLHRLAHYDTLTGLPNWTFFDECLEHALSLTLGSTKQLAMLVVGLDHFRNINDSLGHPVGDAILKEVARRFESALRDQDIVARLGGDEFAVLLENINEPGYVAHVASSLISTLIPAFQIDDKKLTVSASVGICLYNNESWDSVTVIKNAESAMYLAKETGRGKYEFYTPELTSLAMERVTLGHELHLAIEKRQLEVYYQPQYLFSTGEIFGAEALVRWNHPELGPVSPGKFIPIAEEQGLIKALGHQVLNTACAQMAEWLEQGSALKVMAVNVSGHQIHSSDFENILWDTLRKTGLKPRYLQLEITESGYYGACRAYH